MFYFAVVTREAGQYIALSPDELILERACSLHTVPDFGVFGDL